MNQRYKEPETEQKGPVGLDLDIPDITGIMKTLDDQLERREEVAKEHMNMMEKEEEDVKKGKKKERQKPKGGTICFCGNPMCRIGEFVQVEGQ